MIDATVITQVRNGVCAVGYLTVTLHEYRQDFTKPFFKVLGTGFLVREWTVITNRHVIQSLFESQADLGFDESQFFVSFVVYSIGAKPRAVVRMIRKFGLVENEDLDVGFLDFSAVNTAAIAGIAPLRLVSAPEVSVSEEVAVCGYPYGTSMLTKAGRVYRWGPVIQQGSISGVSPFDTADAPTELLLDVRTAPGMSGAPIFRPSSGDVIGIHHSTWEFTTAVGLPLTAQVVSNWLARYDEQPSEPDHGQSGPGRIDFASS